MKKYNGTNIDKLLRQSRLNMLLARYEEPAWLTVASCMVLAMLFVFGINF